MMKTIKILIGLWLMVSPLASAQMRHPGMMQPDSTGYGRMHGNMMMTMPGCMNGYNMMGPRMMDNSYMGMMNRGMMGNRMVNFHHGMTGQMMPMGKYVMMVNLMPSLQQKLSLTDDQVSGLIDMRTAFKKEQVDFQARVAKQRMQLNTLLKANASPDEDRVQLQKCSETRTDMQVAAYETYNKMVDLLNSNQKDQLQNMMPGNMGYGSMMNW